MGIVYMLAYGDMAYIGSTIRSMNERMIIHKSQYKRWLNENKIYCRSFDIIKNENYEIIIIEEIKNETLEECREREQLWINFYGKDNLVNKLNANGFDIKKYQKNYKNENKNKMKEYNKEYYLEYKLNNKNKINEKQKLYYNKNKDIINQKKREYRQKNKLQKN